MSVKTIPASQIFICDACGKESTETTLTDRPRYWVNLDVIQDAYDWSGAAVADGSVHRLLCRDCALKISAAINACCEAIRADLPTPPAKDD